MSDDRSKQPQGGQHQTQQPGHGQSPRPGQGDQQHKGQQDPAKQHNDPTKRQDPNRPDQKRDDHQRKPGQAAE